MTQHALILGVGPGIGLAAARRFGREGFKLSLVSRNPPIHAKTLSSEGLTARVFAADVGNFVALRAALERAEAEQGAADVLIYNAAQLVQQNNYPLEPEEFMNHLRINVGGALAAVQAVAPGMIERGAGTILMTGGGLSLRPSGRYGTLSVGKAGIRSLALTLAQDLEPMGIHVATVTVAMSVNLEAAESIANLYWTLHTQARADWQNEIVFSG
jgi:NAD(P)-dependent dehydrogenase (short-subunit alcohol dehydrogenase family)